MQLQLILIVSFSPHKQYFDFFEEAFNYIANKGYARMGKEDEAEWMDTLNEANASETGKLLTVLQRPVPLNAFNVGDNRIWYN